MAHRLLASFACSSLAIIALSFAAQPVAALSLTNSHAVRHHHIAAHGSVVKREQVLKKSARCKTRNTLTSSASKLQPTKSSQDKPKDDNTPHSSGASSGGKKVGLAWPNPPSIDIAPFVSDKTKFTYTWSPYKVPGAEKHGLTSVPMLWGEKQEDTWYQLVKPGYSTHALGMNEPNQDGQSDMSPGAAASLWKRAIAPLRNKGYTLVSPACTNAPSGLTWMKDFLNSCGGNDCVDIVALHYYGTDPDDFIKHITSYHNAFGKKIWVTEFACQSFGSAEQCSDSEIRDFMAKTTDFMDKTDWVDAYFWFGAMLDMNNVNDGNRLMGSNHKPTKLGAQYLYG